MEYQVACISAAKEQISLPDVLLLSFEAELPFEEGFAHEPLGCGGPELVDEEDLEPETPSPSEFNLVIIS